MSVYTLKKTSCKLASNFDRFDLSKDWYDTMATNITVARDTFGSYGSSDVSWHVVLAAVLCTVAMVALSSAVVYHFLHKRSRPLWITKFYHQDQYSTMKNDDVKGDQFIMGFSNPIMNAKDQTDCSVKPLSYKPLDEDKEPHDKDQYLLQYKCLFPREKLTYGAEIGSGWFGKVYKGEATRIVPGLRKTKVIIKNLCEQSTSEQRKRFIDEITIFKSLNHENVLEVLGVATEQQPYLVVFEYNPLGNLKEYLLSHQSEALSMKKRLNPVKISIDVGSGLEFLHSKGFYHSDLATRNCIVNTDLSVKIGDYGISRDLYKSDYYKDPTSSGESLPIRWLDPESVCVDQDNNVSVKSPEEKENVWSFGVTLWEIVEYGRQPYTGLTDEEVMQTVVVDRLYQLPEPRDSGMVAGQLYDMMKWCWIESTKRPSVEDMVVFLKGLAENISDMLSESSEEQPFEKPSTTINEYRQPVAVVRPLQQSEPVTKQPHETYKKDDKTTLEKSSLKDVSLHKSGQCGVRETNDVQVTAIFEELEDVPVTVINSESSQENELRKDILNEDTSVGWTTPVTYIGRPSDAPCKLDQKFTQGTQDELTRSRSESQVLEVKYSDGEPTVIVEDCPSGYVVLPGDKLRRKSSLRKANTKSRGDTVHFPANILDLRVVHRYYPEEEESENDDEVDGETKEGEPEHSIYPPSSNLTFELKGQGERTSLHDEESQVEDVTEMGSALILERPTSSIEKRVRKATRRKPLNKNADEWLFSIDQWY